MSAFMWRNKHPSVWLLLTPECSQQCAHCYLRHDLEARPQPLVDKSLATRIAIHLNNWTGTWTPQVVLFGGDSAPTGDIAELMQIVRSGAPRSSFLMYVSDQSLDPIAVDQLSRFDPGYVVSVDALANKPEPATASILERLSANTLIRIHATVTGESDVSGFVDRCTRTTAADFTTMWQEWLPSPEPGQVKSMLTGIREAVATSVDRARRGIAPRWVNLASVCALLYYRRRYRVPCTTGEAMLAVDGSADLYPCFRFAGRREYRVGTVAAGVDPVRRDRFLADRTRAVESFCGNCPAWGLCPGRCPFSVLAGSPDYEDFFCVCQRELVAAITAAWDTLERIAPDTLVCLGDITYRALAQSVTGGKGGIG